jgi:hypothetical protein
LQVKIMAGCRRFYVYPDGTYLEERLDTLSLLAEIEFCSDRIRVRGPGGEVEEISIADCIDLAKSMAAEENGERLIDFKLFSSRAGEIVKHCGMSRFLLLAYLLFGTHRISKRKLIDELLGGDREG